MPIRTLGPEGGEFGSGPTSIGGRNKCQQGHWALKAVDCIPYRLRENETFFIKVWKPLPSPKRTIFDSGGLGPLHILINKMFLSETLPFDYPAIGL